MSDQPSGDVPAEQGEVLPPPLGHFRPPRVNARVRLRAADGREFSFVVDAAPEDVGALDRVTARGGHGLMLVRDRRSDDEGQPRGFTWQVWSSSVVGIDATEDAPIPLPS